jgi:hypothetical protein
VVDGEVLARAAVLAGVVVARQNGVPGESELRHGAAHLVAHLQNRRSGQGATDGFQGMFALLKHFDFAKKHQGDRSAHIADVERFVVAIQNKDFVGRHLHFSPVD